MSPEARLRKLDLDGDEFWRPDREMLADDEQIIEADDAGHGLEHPILH
jgi:hypothetical protein